MARDTMTVWYDREGDFLEVTFDAKPGFFRETDSDQVMEKVDRDGNLIGFSISCVSSLQEAPLEVSL